MKRLIDCIYARQRQVSFRENENRLRAEVMRDAGWTVFFLIVVCALLLSGWLG